jgi:hypothetical protein
MNAIEKQPARSRKFREVRMMTDNQLPEMVIPREKAVFWMDRFGRWHNEHGRFEHKKLIDYFNAAIGRDEGGYFVAQNRESVREKVYFFYEDTPLFVVDVRLGGSIELVLNTGRILALAPEDLFVSKDILYVRRGDERIRFTERSMIRFAAHLDYEDGKYAFVDSKGARLVLPEQS